MHELVSPSTELSSGTVMLPLRECYRLRKAELEPSSRVDRDAAGLPASGSGGAVLFLFTELQHPDHETVWRVSSRTDYKWLL